MVELKARESVTASGRPSGTATASTVIAVMMYLVSHRIASQPLLSDVDIEKMQTNLGKRDSALPQASLYYAT